MKRNMDILTDRRALWVIILAGIHVVLIYLKTLMSKMLLWPKNWSCVHTGVICWLKVAYCVPWQIVFRMFMVSVGWMDFLDQTTEQITCFRYRSCLTAWNSCDVLRDFLKAGRQAWPRAQYDRPASNSSSEKHRHMKHATQVLSWISGVTVNNKITTFTGRTGGHGKHSVHLAHCGI